MTPTIKVNKCNCKVFDRHFDFQHERRPIVTFVDKGSQTKYIYTNKSSYYLSKYRVDGGLIHDNQAKCDYLLLNCEKKHSYFIELKGSDINHAIDQIDRSINILKNDLSDFSFFARIVLTRVNTINLVSVKLKKLEKKVKVLNGDLKKQSRQLDENV